VLERDVRYRLVVRTIKGRYRVIIYKHFTLLHCDRSKYVHFARHILDIKSEMYYRTSVLPLHEVNMQSHRPKRVEQRA
jgi:hypothetical protein